MRFAVVVPIWGEYADPRVIRDLAIAVERWGWDGFFVADQIVFDNANRPPVGDATVSLAVAAAATARVTLGSWVTAIPRRRPAKLAREWVALDLLSGGRMVLGAGLGGPPDDEFTTLGEDPSQRIRAEKTDEALDLVARLWSGEPVNHEGKHFTARGVRFTPLPIQRPRVPIWIAVRWPSEAKEPFRRAARWDGMVPVRTSPDWQLPFSPDEMRMLRDRAMAHRTAPGTFTTAFAGRSSDPKDNGLLPAYEAAGVTWWLETFHEWRGALNDTLARIRLGPPRP